LLERNEAGDARANVNPAIERRFATAERAADGSWRGLAARAAEDAAGGGVDVDPDHPAVLDELQPVGVAIELGAQIVGAAHERQHPALDLGKRHRAALALGLERALGIARRVGQRGACEKAGVDFTFIAHAQDIFRYANDARNRIGEIGASPRCLRVLVPSRFHRDYVIARGVPAGKVLINPNGIDPRLYQQAVDPERATRVRRSVCAVHRFTAKKGLESLIRAGKQLERHGIEIHLYGYGELEPAYRSAIAELGLRNVHIHGSVDGREAMLEVFSRHDLFACPSVRAEDGDMDGIPTVLMEAMAAGLPVLSTSLSGIPDLVEDGTTGLVCTPTPEGIAEAILRYYAQAAFDTTGDLYPSPDGVGTLLSERRPLGTVAVITPWNFPVAIPIWKLAPALAYGNTVLFKPSSAAVGTASRLVELISAHLPAGVLGLATVSAKHAGQLLDDPRISGVSFTGSVMTGRRIIEQAAGRGAPVQAEMGGLNASIVLDDADVPAAAQTIAQAAMAYAGQKCTATSRVIVARAVADAFMDAIVTATRALPLGDPLDPSTIIGPLINARARDTVGEAVQGATRRGGTLLTGGTKVERDGWFFSPTLMRLDDPTDDLAQIETFGPVASVLTVDSVEEAVAVANGTPYGLSAAVFSQDTDRAIRVARELEAGLVRVNASTTGVDFYAPFGGDRASSYGPREQGRAAREFYTTTRTFLVNPAYGSSQ